jgi:Uma2 family endonuclease
MNLIGILSEENMEAIAQVGMSLDDFMRRYDEEAFELIEGECIPVSPQAIRSVRIAGKLYRILAPFVESNGLGEAFIEAPFVMKASKKWVKGSRVPDVMFIGADRLKALAENDPDWETSPLPLVPDLVIEVMSPTDRLAAVNRKVKRYLNDGVRCVWVIDAEHRAIHVHTSDSTQATILTEDDKLTGADILTGFELDIAKLFE